MGKMLCFKKQVAKIIFRCKGGISLSTIYFPAIIQKCPLSWKLKDIDFGRNDYENKENESAVARG